MLKPWLVSQAEQQAGNGGENCAVMIAEIRQCGKMMVMILWCAGHHHI